MLIPSVSVMRTQMLTSWPTQVQKGSPGRRLRPVRIPHASMVPTPASARRVTIRSPQRIAGGCRWKYSRNRGIVSDTRTVMPAACTSALCSVTVMWLAPASANSAVSMPAALTLARPTRNQCVDVSRRIVSAVGTSRSYQDAPASGRRSRRAARTVPAASSATPTATVVQWRGISKVCGRATASPTRVTMSPASMRPDPDRRHAMSEPPGGGERDAIVPVELAVQSEVRSFEKVRADRQGDGAAHQIVDAWAQPEVAAVEAGHEQHGGVERVVEGARRQPECQRGRHPRRDARPCQVRRRAHQHLLAELERRVEPLEEQDRKSTRLNSSHTVISYAVFCLKK